MNKISPKVSSVASIALFIFVIGGWEASIRILDVSKIVVPAPSAVMVALWDGISSGEILKHFSVTFYEVIAGFVAGALLGFGLGVLVAQFPLAERALYPYIIAFQTIPKVAIAPIIVIWFGYGISSKVVITATIAFFPVLANTIAGLQAVPREQLELMVAFTASRWQVFRMVRFPQSLPFVFVGLDVAIVLSVIGAIVGEFVGSHAGLGYLILQAQFNLDMAMVFAQLIVLSLLGIGLHLCMRAIQRRVVFWIRNADDQIVGA
ncbi:ABC transporter permease [Caenimonas soli]|uniref:ABC transporter permease n=1 Tax=Caenimonas soli TaxID=2735555 RepID=UPI0015582B93|nr:ABC transporter permease [Caenimonas soli]NPC58555.1 ABC transporter permease [Caenimonas soli]